MKKTKKDVKDMKFYVLRKDGSRCTKETPNMTEGEEV